jgi:hypothetical protein
VDFHTAAIKFHSPRNYTVHGRVAINSIQFSADISVRSGPRSLGRGHNEAFMDVGPDLTISLPERSLQFGFRIPFD